MLTFYHTTSAFYIKSIKDNGLGSINPNINFNLLPFLKEMLDIAETKIPENIQLNKLSFTTKKMLNLNEKSTSLLNDSRVHLYPSLDLAIKHSKNKYGSQVLSRCIDFYTLLKKNNLTQLIKKSNIPFSIEMLIDEKPENYILELKNITPQEILSENVTKIEDLFSELNDFKEKDSKLFNIISSQFTFELKSVIPASRIIFFKEKHLKHQTL